MRVASVLLSLSLGALAAVPTVRALNWTGTREQPAFSVQGGERIRGVNLGGLFILEAWMQSSMFGVAPLDQQQVPDEWTYCNVLGPAECSKRLEQHWSTFITEDDLISIAAAGLNTVRIPVGYWMWTGLVNGEPYAQGQIPYLRQILKWSLKHGIDVMMDLHGLPGSQNGNDHSGVVGPIGWATNSSNIDRSLQALAAMTVEVTKPEYQGVVKAIEVINEPWPDTMGGNGGCTFDQLADYYVRAYDTVRGNETVLSGSEGVMVVVHDAFYPVLNWDYFFNAEHLGSSWVNFGLDTHIYGAFGGAASRSTDEQLGAVCAGTSTLVQAQAGWATIVGEMSIGVRTYCVDYQDCFGVGMAQQLDNSTEHAAFEKSYWSEQKLSYEQAAGWIFWNWKTDAAPEWSFKQSMASGWIEPNVAVNSFTIDPKSSWDCIAPASPTTAAMASPTTAVYSPSSSTLASAVATASASSPSSSTAPNSDPFRNNNAAAGIGASEELEDAQQASGGRPSRSGASAALLALLAGLCLVFAL